MPYPKKISDLSPDAEFYSEAILMHQRAEEYLGAFRWCRSLESCHIYVNLGSKLCVFLFRIVNSQSPADDRLWVIVGDLPAMYLDGHDIRSTKAVLLAYVDWAEDWVTHVLANKSLERCYPFHTDATPEVAVMLAQRATFIRTMIVGNMDDVKQRAL